MLPPLALRRRKVHNRRVLSSCSRASAAMR